MNRILIFLILFSIGGCSIKEEYTELEEQVITQDSDALLEVESETESTTESEVLLQLPAPINIKGSIDDETNEITLSWEYEFPNNLEEEKYGEFHFVLCADDVYGGTHVFSYLPKNYTEVTFEIDSFTNTTLTKNIYLYAQQGIEDGQRISEKSEYFQYKDSDADPIPVTPYD